MRHRPTTEAQQVESPASAANGTDPVSCVCEVPTTGLNGIAELSPYGDGCGVHLARAFVAPDPDTLMSQSLRQREHSGFADYQRVLAEGNDDTQDAHSVLPFEFR
jgi:hypothetical protein